jgi:hypothetical protein
MSRPLISSLFSLVAQMLDRLPVSLIQFLCTTINRSAPIRPRHTATITQRPAIVDRLTNHPDNSPPVQLPNV